MGTILVPLRKLLQGGKLAVLTKSIYTAFLAIMYSSVLGVQTAMCRPRSRFVLRQLGPTICAKRPSNCPERIFGPVGVAHRDSDYLAAESQASSARRGKDIFHLADL